MCCRATSRPSAASPSRCQRGRPQTHPPPTPQVCDDGFTNVEATAACRKLGLPTPGYAAGGARLGRAPDTSPIWLTRVQCASPTASFDDCRRSAWGVGTCTHMQDVSVSCGAPVPGARPPGLAHRSAPNSAASAPPLAPRIVPPVAAASQLAPPACVAQWANESPPTLPCSHGAPGEWRQPEGQPRQAGGLPRRQMGRVSLRRGQPTTWRARPCSGQPAAAAGPATCLIAPVCRAAATSPPCCPAASAATALASWMPAQCAASWAWACMGSSVPPKAREHHLPPSGWTMSTAAATRHGSRTALPAPGALCPAPTP